MDVNGNRNVLVIITTFTITITHVVHLSALSVIHPLPAKKKPVPASSVTLI